MRTESIFSVIEIEKNKLVRTVSKLEKSFIVSFELFITKHTDENRCALHMTTGGNSGQYGYRIPLVLLLHDDRLAIRSAVSGKDDYSYDGNTKFVKGKWYKLIIEQVPIDSKVFLLDTCEL